jgi:predicted ATPase/DNA-binding XRE family transcriptional regulator
MAEAPTFGSLLRRFRVAAGLTQEALAERAGLSVRAISDLETGAHTAPYQVTVEALAQALDLRSDERSALAASVSRQRRPRAAPAAAQQQAVAIQSPLPVPLTPLIDRQRETAVLTELLTRSELRLLTITGPGGVGKTRLAIMAASQVAAERGLPVAFVPLSGLNDPALVLQTLARALGIRADDHVPVDEQVVVSLADRPHLVLLDTMEHLLPAGPTLARLLERCPHLTALVTSRSPLNVRGERVFAVSPLTLPEETRTAAATTELEQVPAVALFVARTTELVADFALTEHNMAAVVGIARRLDGLPLALELAAAWTRVLSPEALMNRLERRLPLLTTGARDAPAHQRTLRDTIRWSYDLLESGDQRLFRALAIFPRSCALDLIAAISSPDGDGETTSAPVSGELILLEQLATLVDHALVIREARADGAHRFRMLDTIREFALEEAAANGERDSLRHRLTVAVVDLASRAYRGLHGPEQRQWFQRLDDDLETIRAVMSWTADDDPELGADLGWYLWDCWLNRAQLRESLTWIERLLERMGPQTAPNARVRALFVAAALAVELGEGASRRAYLEESAALARQHGYLPELASALGYLALAAGNPAHSHEATAVARRTGDRALLAVVFSSESLMLGALGDHEAVERMAAERRALFDEVGDLRLEAAAVLFEAIYVDVPRGELVRAGARFEYALGIFRELGYADHVCHALAHMARIAVTEEDVDLAAARYDEALGIARDVGDVRVIASCLDGKAWVAHQSGAYRQGVRLWAAVTAWRTANPHSWARIPSAYTDVESVSARAMLGDEAFAAAQAAGQALSLSAAIAEALPVESVGD